MKRFLAVGALLLALGASARADSFTATIIQTDTAQLSNSQYAGTFAVTDNTTHLSFTAYCADTTDEVSFGTTSPITGTISFGGMPSQILTGPPQNLNIWGNTLYTTDLGNKLDYLLTQIMAPTLGTLTASESAGLQGAIWSLEGNYASLHGLTATTDPLLFQVLALVGAPGANGTGPGTGWLSGIAAYSTSTTYASSNEILVIPASSGNSSGNPLQYQVLVGVLATPEPSTFAIAGLGALGFLGYGWKRRKSS